LDYNNLFAASYILLGLQCESMTKLSTFWEQGPTKILTCAKNLNDKVKQLQTNDNKTVVYIPHLGKYQPIRSIKYILSARVIANI